jgi:hypothetical protein
MLGIVLDLAANAVDAKVDGAIEGARFTMADAFQDPIALERPVWIVGEELQQVEFTGG